MTRGSANIQPSNNSQNFHKIKNPRFSSRSCGTGYSPIAKNHIPQPSIVYPVNAIRIVFVTNFVDALALARTHIEPVWTIDDDAVDITDIPIGMNDALWNQHGPWIVLS